MRFSYNCPTFHITGTAISKAKCSIKSTAFQFSDVQDAVGKHHPDKLLLNSSFAAQLKKNDVLLAQDNSNFQLFFLINFDSLCYIVLFIYYLHSLDSLTHV